MPMTRGEGWRMPVSWSASWTIPPKSSTRRCGRWKPATWCSATRSSGIATTACAAGATGRCSANQRLRAFLRPRLCPLPGNPRENQHFPQKCSLKRKEKRNRNKKRTEGNGEGEARSNVVSFPPSRPGGTSAEQRVEQTTLQLAHILKITANFALRRIAEEYLDNPLLSLLGEADAAREYIDDRQHNRKGQRMTPAFFRRWLKREHEDALLRRARSTQATGTAGPEGDHSVT